MYLDADLKLILRALRSYRQRMGMEIRSNTRRIPRALDANQLEFYRQNISYAEHKLGQIDTLHEKTLEELRRRGASKDGN